MAVAKALARLNKLKAQKIMNNKLVLILLSIFLAPVAVFLKKGVGKDLIINIVLCFIFYFPAVIHALLITTK